MVSSILSSQPSFASSGRRRGAVDALRLGGRPRAATRKPLRRTARPEVAGLDADALGQHPERAMRSSGAVHPSTSQSPDRRAAKPHAVRARSARTMRVAAWSAAHSLKSTTVHQSMCGKHRPMGSKVSYARQLSVVGDSARCLILSHLSDWISPRSRSRPAHRTVAGRRPRRCADRSVNRNSARSEDARAKDISPLPAYLVGAHSARLGRSGRLLHDPIFQYKHCVKQLRAVNS